MDYHNNNSENEMVDISSSGANTNNEKSHKKGHFHDDSADGNKSKKKKIIITTSIISAVILIAGVSGFVLYSSGFFNSKPELFVDNVFRFEDEATVSGISIGHKTFEEAKQLLEENKSSFLKPLSISVDVNGEIIKLNEKDFDYTYDIDSVLNTIKNDEIEAASAEVRMFQETTTVSKTYAVTATVTVDSIAENTKKIEEKTNKQPVNAHVSEFKPYVESRFVYEDAVPGCNVDAQKLEQQITKAFVDDQREVNIIADTETIKANIQVSDLKTNLVKLSTYETVSYNTANGTSNMKIALESCNGSIIEPGATWSFNRCTGDSNLESNGYKSAHVISEGKLVDGIGGGICQASSTIYNAALRANMDVEERYNHKWASSYVPTGLDATIDYPNLDLKLSNPTDYQMFLECKVYDGNVLSATIWGYKSPSYDLITTHNEITNKGSKSYTVKAWRIFYKDGKEVNRESLGSSTYDMENGVVFYNADNDSNAKGVDYDVIEEPNEDKSDEESSSKSESESSDSSSSEPESSTVEPETSKTEPPTESPTSKPEPTTQN